MNKKSGYIQVITAVNRRSEAARIAKLLCERKLSACTQIVGPVLSVYRWKGEVEESKEWVCVIKSKRSCYKKIESTIKEMHSYELPEIIVTPIIGGSKDYLDWIAKEV